MFRNAFADQNSAGGLEIFDRIDPVADSRSRDPQLIHHHTVVELELSCDACPPAPTGAIAPRSSNGYADRYILDSEHLRHELMSVAL